MCRVLPAACGRRGGPTNVSQHGRYYHNPDQASTGVGGELSGFSEITPEVVGSAAASRRKHSTEVPDGLQRPVSHCDTASLRRLRALANRP